ncbi:MerR family transcriptional regulator [Hoyosella rhizosphaerae]|uniref:Transcriptional regulator n=1 Tax=Hoyosella rhizosphaerae TaxID=1755582 RepID=A0A916TZW6_9ACTN|nr:MerR family transcriptional regulator [Hoyosella rhizosphaerae]MBN4926991.1 MerR family transcriptional regulator [Hoyosella rhizosphaerae]GGC54909.1 transcriptional regulator [Hoyosella rhizosphaerae]
MLIGEVSQRSGVSTRMLRHYDSLGLVRPTGRTSGGYRAYSGNDIERIFHVECLRSLGLTLREIQRALDDPEFAPEALVSDLVRQAEQRIAREKELLTRLNRVTVAEPTDWADVLHVVKLLRALDSKHAALRQRAILSSSDGESLPAEILADAALSETDPNVAGAIEWALARAGDVGLERVAAGLQSEDVEVRLRAVSAIVAIESTASTEMLRGLLTDPDDNVRRRVALALGSRGCLDSGPALIDMVVSGANDVEAAELLGAMSSSDDVADGIVRALVNRLGSDAKPRARLRLAQALAEIPGSAAQEALTVMTRDVDRTVALTAESIMVKKLR